MMKLLSPKVKWSLGLAASVLLVWGLSSFLTNKPDPKVDDDALIGEIVAAEETLLELTPTMAALSKGMLNLHLPSALEVGYFSKDFQMEPLWDEMFTSLDWLEQGKVYLIKGKHSNGDESKFEADAGFEALGKLKTGEWAAYQGKMKLHWEQSGEAWKIHRWFTEKMEVKTSKSRYFEEVLDSVVSRTDAAKLRASEHYAATVKFYQDGQKSPPHPYFSTISTNQKPGVSVADINGDGFDDIYVTVRMGTNKLLMNQGDGTFVEQAREYGLDLPGHTTCSLFADFDNDGDLDALLGRSLLKLAYLENVGRTYIQHKAPAWAPLGVVSMAAADYNKDGLLDVYLCTYRPAAPASSMPTGGVAQVPEGNFDWMDEFLPAEQATEYRKRMGAGGGRLLDQIGPPNILLVNRGKGSFMPASENTSVGVWRNSLQATWSDFDKDGDPDLYLANDWGPDNFFRNDGASGFADITAAANTTAYGFAMGASWGDYDNDGREDIYVSNMYSKAGRRIISQVPGLDKIYGQSAEGNWLYRQTPEGKFDLVSGLEPPKLTVTKAGWSWGGKFADFNNDGWLDIYALSGYFTAPKELSSELDL